MKQACLYHTRQKNYAVHIRALKKALNNGLILKEVHSVIQRTYAYLINDYNNDDYDKNKIIDKKAKGTKKCVIKRELMFESYKDSLFNNKIILKSQQRFKSDHHRVYTEEVNKIALSSNDDKRLQTFDRITMYRIWNKCF